MFQSSISGEKIKKICPNGHGFDDDELNYCPECGLPLKAFNSLQQASNELESPKYPSQNDANDQYQQYEISNHLQSQDTSSQKSTTKKHLSGVAIFFVIMFIALATFVLLEVTNITHLIPVLHSQMEPRWFTVNLEVYDSDEYFYVGNLTVELPEGHVDLESFLPKRYVFNGEQYSFHSVVPSSVNIESDGDMDTGDIAVHYSHNN